MIALSLFEQGVLVVPASTDAANKSPLVPYAHWRESAPTLDEYSDIWQRFPDAGLLMLCEGVECVDLDTKNQEWGDNIIADFETELEAICPGLLRRLFIEQTPSGGRHYIYKTHTPGASCTLARRPSNEPGVKFKTLVDYLAHGKLCRIFPTPGYIKLNGDILTIPLIEDDERRAILSAALSLNTYIEQPEYHTSDHNGVRPGDAFNERTSGDDMLDIFQQNGWRFLRRRGHYIDLNRPGAKTKGVDGVINAEQKWFYPWSSSCGFPDTRAYDFFGAYAVLQHGGDIKRASAALAAQGYGSGPTASPNAPGSAQPNQPARHSGSTPTTQCEAAQDWTSLLSKHQFSFENDYNAKWVVYHKSPYSPYSEKIPLAAMGQMLVIAGMAKSFKTQVACAIVSAALGKPHQLGFYAELPEDQSKIVLFDTEQDSVYFGGAVKRIHWMAGINHDVPNFKAYSLVQFSAKERMDAIMSVVDSDPTIGMVVIDGLLDLVNDYSNTVEATFVGNYFLHLKSRGILVVIVAHTGQVGTSRFKPIGVVGSMIERKAEAIILAVVQNPEEEDSRERRVIVKPHVGRGRGFLSFEIMSYEKMAYLAGHNVPEHYYTFCPARTESPAAPSDNTPQQIPPILTREEPTDEQMQLGEAINLLQSRDWLLEIEKDDKLFDDWLNSEQNEDANHGA